MKYQPDNFSLEDTTIWSFTERGNWATHKGDYRGNCQCHQFKEKYYNAI